MPPSPIQDKSIFKRLSRNKAFGNFIAILAVGLSFFALCYFAIIVYPIDARMETPGKWVFGVDWKEFIGPDVRLLLSGGNPYLQHYTVMNDAHGLYPPWAYLLLSPLTLFTPGLGSVFIFSITYMAFALVLWKLRYKWSVILLILLSPFIYQCAWSGNIDWLAALGFIMPAPIGLIFALIKPQVGIGIAIYWLAEA